MLRNYVSAESHAIGLFTRPYDDQTDEQAYDTG
jgi:hypothetical protein